MIDAITKTFLVAHVDDTDEHLAQALVYNAGRLAWRMQQLSTNGSGEVKGNVSHNDAGSGG